MFEKELLRSSERVRGELLWKCRFAAQ